MPDLETARVRCPHCGFVGGIDDFNCVSDGDCGGDVDPNQPDWALEYECSTHPDAWFCTECAADFLPEPNVVAKQVQLTLHE